MRAHRVGWLALAATTAVLGGAGAVLGPAPHVLLVGCAVGVCAGALLRASMGRRGALGRRGGRLRGPGGPAVPAGPVTGAVDSRVRATVAGWSVDRLCWEWVHSSMRLQQAPSPAAKARVAEQRRCYLDELERRDPQGFAAWIGGGAAASSDPRRHLTAPADRPGYRYPYGPDEDPGRSARLGQAGDHGPGVPPVTPL